MLFGISLLLGMAALAGGPESYVLRDSAHFESIRAEALECLHHQTALGRLDAFYSALPPTAAPGTLVTQRAYLAYRKLLKYCRSGSLDQLLKPARANGQFDETSILLGAKAELFRGYSDFVEKHPELSRFGHALYQEDADCPGKSSEAKGPPSIATMIPQKEAVKARKIAREILESYARRFNLTALTAVAFSRGMGLTTVDDGDGPGRDWAVGVLIDPDGLTLEIDHAKYFVPSEFIALHELGHVERIMPGDPGRKTSTGLDDAKVEIGPVLEQIIYTDEVYKQLHRMKLEAVVSYPSAIPGNFANPAIGVLANTFRGLWKKYGSIESALMSKEGLEFVSRYYRDSCP